ncbi:MAG: glycosyltransferase family 2 protein [Chloroherpetonaceae bacterium]|nr:glycosyltransferase family 2 protein [Chloroherpetonaceae bacterium]
MMAAQATLFYYQLFILACLLVFFGILIKNLFDLRFLFSESTEYPFVSILVPARNEEHNIERCVRSLLAQDYPKFEVIVLNDHSTDRTGEILTTLQQREARLRVLNGKDLPNGWLGKAWACQQLAEAAHGELLLFTDADTAHRPSAVRRAVATLLTTKSDMLTVVPYQVMESFWEKMGVPLVHFLIMCFLPLSQVWKSRNTAFSFACGQFILFRRKFYEKIGGHRAVRTALVEDVWLVKATKRAGGKAMVFNGIDAVNCRMYHSLSDVWKGFSKNLFAGVNYNYATMVAIALMMCACFVAPYLFLIGSCWVAPFSCEWFSLPLLQILLAVLMRLLIAWRFKLPQISAWLHLVSMMLFIGIAFNSMRLIWSGKGAEWKGRRYDFSEANKAHSVATVATCASE